ncbi:MAG: hypothetical protein HQK77_13735 [Desulfobacterales bacterium]|nr:hypothetical protein [Desulfobacterales bacterium]
MVKYILKTHQHKKYTLILFMFFLCFAYSQLDASNGFKILVVNSNAEVEKYKTVQEEFVKLLPYPVYTFNLGDHDISEGDLKTIKSYDPDLVYSIGGRAYSFVNKHFSDRQIVFSSIINWMRLHISKDTYGLSNELHVRLPIYIYRSLFPDIKKIGIIYSKQFTLQWFKQTRSVAKELDIEIIGKVITDKKNVLSILTDFVKEVDALWLISDPFVMPDISYLEKIISICNENKIPVFSYHDAFVSLGVVLSVSVDNPTIGRQASGITEALLSGEKLPERIQLPAGSHVTLNLKKVKDYGIKYDIEAFRMVNTFVKEETTIQLDKEEMP